MLLLIAKAGCYDCIDQNPQMIVIRHQRKSGDINSKYLREQM